MYSLPKPPAVSAVTQLVGKITRPLGGAAMQFDEKSTSKDPQNHKKSTYSLHKSAIKTALKVKNNFAQSQQLRFLHSDVTFPDYTPYKRKQSLDTKVSQEATEPSRKLFSYLVVGGSVAGGAYVAKSLVQEMLDYVNVTQDILALAKIEVELGDIPEGQNLTVKWRGNPIFIRHRTMAEADTERSVDLAQLRDPQHDADRTQKPEWAILIGICTHLGCVPVPLQGDYNGYFCPCHGSHYDLSGRIRRGPAPLNLDVPPHKFSTDDLLVIG